MQVRQSTTTGSPDGTAENLGGINSPDESSGSTSSSNEPSSSILPTAVLSLNSNVTERRRTRSMTRAKAFESANTSGMRGNAGNVHQALPRSTSVDSAQVPRVNEVPAVATSSACHTSVCDSGNTSTHAHPAVSTHLSESDNEKALAAGEAPRRDIDLFERPTVLPGGRVFRYATGVRRVPPSGTKRTMLC